LGNGDAQLDVLGTSVVRVLLQFVHAEAEAVVPLQWAERLLCPLLRRGGRCRSTQRATSGNQGVEGDEAIACGAKS